MKQSLSFPGNLKIRKKFFGGTAFDVLSYRNLGWFDFVSLNLSNVFILNPDAFPAYVPAIIKFPISRTNFKVSLKVSDFKFVKIAFIIEL